MWPTTIRLNEQTRKMLDDYCQETGKKISEALRDFVKNSLERYKQKNEVGFENSVGSKGLMVNEKRAIRASLECLYMLRSLIKDPSVLGEINKRTTEVLGEGWFYDNK